MGKGKFSFSDEKYCIGLVSVNVKSGNPEEPHKGHIVENPRSYTFPFSSRIVVESFAALNLRSMSARKACKHALKRKFGIQVVKAGNTLGMDHFYAFDQTDQER
jgi:hypothetical protein